MAMEAAGRRGISARMNVTPMIDVLLVLLIIYMLIAPASKGMDVAIPQPPPTHSDHEKPVVLQIAQTNAGEEPSLRINQENVGWAELHARLAEIVKIRVDKTLFVQGDRELEFTTVARAMDIAHGAGFERIGIITSLPHSSR